MKVRMIETAKDTDLRLAETNAFELKEANGATIVTIDTTKEFQTMVGFGGAMTESATYTLSRMSEAKRAEVIEKYYHPEKGLNYNIGRVHIHSCDFSLGNYTYVEEGDKELKTFDISREHKWVIPFIKDAEKMRGKKIGILASPWSPPAWMKTNGEMNHGGQLLPEYFETWAIYYTKFIKAMRAEGINIDCITVQNEPAAVQTWDSCIYSAAEERDFVKNFLGPIMHREGLADVKIYIWDHNRDIMIDRAKTVLEDSEAAKYVYGTGIHWYVSEAFENVGIIHDMFPDKHILFTEGCQEGGVHLGAWSTGERYARNMIGDISNWCEGYLDWNIVLDETGGPNHVNNLCDAPIIADTRTDELIYNSSYFYIGHFSKYVQEGAKRVGIEIADKELLGVAFKNEDGSVATVLLNQTTKAKEVSLVVGGNPVSLTIRANGIVTLITA